MSSPEREEETEIADDIQAVKDEAVEPQQAEPESIVIEKPQYSTKSVKKLSKDERAMLMSKFEKHEEDPYFKVIRMADGGIRITKRKIPLNSDVREAQKIRAAAIENKSKGHLTNEQLLMEHIIDIEARLETMRLKHKKLKKRYNELESNLYEDVKDEPVGVKDEQQPEPQQPQQRSESPQQRSEALSTKCESPRKRRTTWRDMIQYM